MNKIYKTEFFPIPLNVKLTLSFELKLKKILTTEFKKLNKLIILFRSVN